jgi:hypothetical protein
LCSLAVVCMSTFFFPVDSLIIEHMISMAAKKNCHRM